MESSQEEYASELFDLIQDEYENAVERAKPDGQAIKLECQTDFGPVWVTRISTLPGRGTLRIEALDEAGLHFLFLIDPFRASFRFSRFTPTEAQKNIIAGFGPEKAVKDLPKSN